MNVFVVLCGVGMFLVGGLMLIFDSVVLGVVWFMDVLEIDYFN